MAKDEVSSYYDPMIAKIIAYGVNRNDAINKLSFALENTRLGGIKNNIDFLNRIIKVSAFEEKKINTDFINRFWEKIIPSKESKDLLLESAAALYIKYRNSYNISKNLSPWHNNINWRHLGNDFENISLTYDKEVFNYAVKVLNPSELLVIDEERKSKNIFKILNDDFTKKLNLLRNNEKIEGMYFKVNNDNIYINQSGYSLNLNIRDKFYLDIKFAASEGSMDSPVPGKVAKVFSKKNQEVKKGDVLVIIEAMKMEHSILAPYSGKIIKINVKEGQQVDEGYTVVQMKA
jgi:3-methylcrotonyl-CoA carboxylase alpha subunit